MTFNFKMFLLLKKSFCCFRNAKNRGLLSVLKEAKEPTLVKPKVVEMERPDNGYGFFLKLDQVKFKLV